jgi:multicomponent Na+:H+ antiporter subunit E
MTALVWNLVLAFVWALATGKLTFPGLAAGFALGYIVLLFSRRLLPSSGYFRKPWQLVRFALFFAWEVVLANLRVAHDVVTPKLHMMPSILAIPLDARTEEEITLLAGLITLTPGTLSIEVSPDRRTLFIHAMFVDDAEAFRRDLKNGFERRLLELLR